MSVENVDDHIRNHLQRSTEDVEEGEGGEGCFGGQISMKVCEEGQSAIVTTLE